MFTHSLLLQQAVYTVSLTIGLLTIFFIESLFENDAYISCGWYQKR